MTKLTEQAFEKLQISYVGANFREWFYPLPFNPKAKVKTLKGQKLPRAMRDAEIMKELNPGEVSIEEIVATLKTLDHAVWALLYCKDINGELRTVSVFWSGDGWYVDANPVPYPYEWYDVLQVFARNSRDTKTLGTSDPLTLGPLVTRIEKLEEMIEKLKEALQ